MIPNALGEFLLLMKSQSVDTRGPEGGEEQGGGGGRRLGLGGSPQ